MRIIGGLYRSRLISMPDVADVRPTQDKVRQAVFNLLGDIQGRRVLDLFAGSGAFGIEALSRGASFATFLDNNFKCTETVRSNLESLRIDPSYYDIIRTNALSVFSRLSGEEKYDIVFLDPPYYHDMAKKCLINIDAYDIVSPIGLVIAEHFKKDVLPKDLKTLVFDKERRYGDTVITIFRKIHEESQGSDIPGHV